MYGPRDLGWGVPRGGRLAAHWYVIISHRSARRTGVGARARVAAAHTKHSKVEARTVATCMFLVTVSMPSPGHPNRPARAASANPSAAVWPVHPTSHARTMLRTASLVT